MPPCWLQTVSYRLQKAAHDIWTLAASAYKKVRFNKNVKSSVEKLLQVVYYLLLNI